VDFINRLNAQWVTAAKRFSPRVLTELFDRASTDLANWFETLSLDAPALFGVSWAGEEESEGWFDIGREFTELWHHQQQIRMAVGAPSLSDSRYLRAVIDIAMRGLPHAFRDVSALPGETVLVDPGSAGGQWTLCANWDERSPPAHPVATTQFQLLDDAAWKLLFNGRCRGSRGDQVDGRADLAALLRARSLIV
jgi:hypothetical protein